MHVLLRWASVVGLIVFVPGASAGLPPAYPATVTYIEKGGTETQNKGYVGLAWSLDGHISWLPNFLLAGYRSLKVKFDESVEGSEAQVRVKLREGIALDSARATFLTGKTSALGNAGLGYSWAEHNLLVTGAAQTDYARAGLDYALGTGRLTPYVELNSLKTDKVEKTREVSSISCIGLGSPTWDGSTWMCQ